MLMITFGKCTPGIEEAEKRPENCLKEEKRHNFPEIFYRHVLRIMKALIKGSAKEHIPPVRIWGTWKEPSSAASKRERPQKYGVPLHERYTRLAVTHL